MFQNVVLKGLGIYYPDNEIDNQFFIDHFNAMGIEAEGLMNSLGRKKRYLTRDDKENSLTMGINAAKKALENAGMAADELDMIVFVSETPEFLVPTNALIINNKVGAVNAHIVYDMNDNCIGMLAAMDNISRYMKGNPNAKKALIVGSLHITSIVRKDCPISYPNISDGSSAIILERIEEERERGFIDSDYFTDSQNFDMMQSPDCGMSKLFDPELSANDKKLKWVPHDVSFFSTEWEKLINKLLDRNRINPGDIDHYLFSQFSKPDTLETLDKLGLMAEKQTFVGEKYGYMGCSSPFYALYDAFADSKISPGSKVIFCSVGAGFTMCAVLFVL